MIRASAALLLLSTSLFGQEVYRKPPKEIADLLNLPPAPGLSVNPTRTYATMSQGTRYPTIAEVSAPMLRLAGLRIDPRTNGMHLARGSHSVTLVRLSDGSQTAVKLPSNPRVGGLQWSPDGKMFAFTNTTANSIELWIGDPSGATRRIEGVKLNAVGGDPIDWLDAKTLLVQTVPANRGAVPQEPPVPPGPNVQESAGKGAPTRTLQDMLQNAHDERLFDYYATAQPAIVDVTSGKTSAFGHAAIFRGFRPSPDGKHFLVTRIKKPYSYLHGVNDFPREIEVWDRSGKAIKTMASLPLNERVPGPDDDPNAPPPQPGPRNLSWKINEPSTLMWVEALDRGVPRGQQVAFRDKLVTLKSPFNGEPAELLKTEQRFSGIQFADKGTWALLSDSTRGRGGITRTFWVDLAKADGERRLIWSRNPQDRYKDPGRPVSRGGGGGDFGGRGGGGGGGRGGFGGGGGMIMTNGEWIYLQGAGSSPEGDRPFLDRFNMTTLKSERIFQSSATALEQVQTLLDDTGTKYILRRESPTEPPNYYIKSDAGLKALTKNADPAPQLRQITRQRVTYKRSDGVPLSFTLYLPSTHKAGTRLPTVMWAYPREYEDPEIAAQVTGSTQRFTTISGMSHLFFLMQGYTILDDAAMPVIGNSRTVNDTYIDQITMDAQAAIDKAVEMGWTDRQRVGVGGHSYGAFMTGNLLAHTDLFRAGIARSGAYNRTLTPFGFQSERRSIWEAPDTYLKMSPFLVANKIKEPLLLIHGEADNNSGTFPIQSERMYAAVRGNGGTVRLVFLPNESHGYQAKESIEHTLWEMTNWFEKHVKNAPPVTSQTR